MRIALLTSSSAPGIERLLADPNRGSVYELAAVLGSEPRLAQQELLERARVPVVLRPIKPFHAEHGLPFRNLNARAEYDTETAGLLASFGADYVLLAGYRYIVTEPLLNAYPQKMIALHDGDLTIRDDDNRRRYSGSHAVREAILSGEDATRSSAYIVTRDVGEGPLFLMSGEWPVAQLARDARTSGDVDTLCSYADLHRTWMKNAVWGEMLVRITELLAGGAMRIVSDLVFIDGAPAPCRLGHAPSMCHELHSATPRIPESCPFFTL